MIKDNDLEYIDLSLNIANDLVSAVTATIKDLVKDDPNIQRVLTEDQVIAHVIDFRGDPENVEVVLRPAGYAHFFFLMPLKKLLEQNNENMDLGLITKLCSKAEELCPESPDNRDTNTDTHIPTNPVYMRAKEMLQNFQFVPSYVQLIKGKQRELFEDMANEVTFKAFQDSKCLPSREQKAMKDLDAAFEKLSKELHQAQ